MQSIRRRQLIDATLEAINEWACTMQRSRRSPAVQAFLRDHQPLFQGQKWSAGSNHARYTSQLRDAVLNRLHALPQGSESSDYRRLLTGISMKRRSVMCDESLVGVLGQQYASADALPLQQVSSRRLLSNLVSEFHRGYRANRHRKRATALPR